ncbi:MAG: hypothetical protein HC903_04505 [Methylacidiphilales bacterium]|nr:hypothetical protein [Candidatus Methylacidiphilales bacterium]
MVRASCPQIIKDGQDAHPTKLGNLFFGDPLCRNLICDREATFLMHRSYVLTVLLDKNINNYRKIRKLNR